MLGILKTSRFCTQVAETIRLLGALGLPVWMVCAAGSTSVFADEPTRVVLVSPRDKATKVNVETLVQIHFSTGLKLETITADSVRLLDPAGKPVASKLGSDIEGDVVNIQPSARLTRQTTYTLEVNNKLKGKEGIPFAAFRSTFTTGADLPPNGSVHATFSPPGDHRAGRLVSADVPSRRGPRHSGQSLASSAAKARRESPAATASWRRRTIREVGLCVGIFMR